MNRRMMLKVGGASILVSGLAASGVWFNTRTPEKALEPWEQPLKNLGDIRLNILAYAILAPSPHNRQPWQVYITNENTMHLYCRLERRLPETDPYDRQILVGLGCFAEMFAIAASHYGYHAEITPFPDGVPDGSRLDSKKVATFHLKKASIKQDPLFPFIRNRRSSKVAFDVANPLTHDNLAQITFNDSIAATNETNLVKQLNQLTSDALTLEMTLERTLKESIDLMRIGKAEIETSPDGIDLSGAPMEIMKKVGMMDKEAMYNPQNSMNTTALSMFKEKFQTTQSYVWVTSPDNSRHAQFNAGRDYLRLNLQATALGLGMQPLSQCLQEFPEMDEYYQKVHEKLGIKLPQRIQMLARIGYCAPVAPSPRWPIETVLLKA